ncbi:MAG: sugar phosphate isomerase/epimerase [Ruminococcaceae bacterium]|nr:sugar phosphate isomerase/epimerase [Oscillospiraceae bacterium]
MFKVYCSTGAIVGRPNGRDFTLLGKYRRLIDCDGYEFMMYDSWYERLRELTLFMRTFEMPIPTFHVEKSIGELASRNIGRDAERARELFRINCELALELGADKLILHLWNGVLSDKNIENNFNIYGDLAEISDSYGLELTVENVVCGYGDPMSRLISLAERYPDAVFTYDTKMAQFHGQLELIYKEENRFIFNKIKHIHVNDYSGAYRDFKSLRTLHIGDGSIDFKSFFEFLKREKYMGDFTVEATSFDSDGIIDYKKLNQSIYRIKELLR